MLNTRLLILIITWGEPESKATSSHGVPVTSSCEQYSQTRIQDTSLASRGGGEPGNELELLLALSLATLIAGFMSQ